VEQDAGWVELLSGDPPEVSVGRARAIVTFAPLPPEGATQTQRGQLVSTTAPWEGRLESVHLANGIAGLERGSYHLRFEANGETLLIELDEWIPLPPDRSGSAVIHSLDQKLPAVILELGGE
jgi:hypothetical protein